MDDEAVDELIMELLGYADEDQREFYFEPSEEVSEAEQRVYQAEMRAIVRRHITG